jgi:excisionase family DNA binding protein
MTALEVELEELEARLAKLKAKAREAAAVAAAPKEGGSALGSNWDGHDSFTVPEAAKILKISRGQAYDAVNDGTLPSIRIGRRYIVPRRAREKMLDGGAP